MRQIRIVFENMVPYPLTLVTRGDAESLSDRSNSRLGLDREAICAIVGRFMEPDFNSTAPQRCAR